MRRLSVLTLGVACLVGCGEPAATVEQTPPTKQKVVMVPAVGNGATNQAPAPAPGGSGQPGLAPGSTPDAKQPGDR